jgi:transcriptional regulatory protein LEU3
MALLAVESRARPMETIKGLLLLCLWPVPVNTMHKDVSVVLSGAAIHVAMQIGLHITGRAHDFARTKLERSQLQKIDRTNLWIHCLIVYHRYGLLPLIFSIFTKLKELK